MRKLGLLFSIKRVEKNTRIFPFPFSRRLKGKRSSQRYHNYNHHDHHHNYYHNHNHHCQYHHHGTINIITAITTTITTSNTTGISITTNNTTGPMLSPLQSSRATPLVTVSPPTLLLLP
jgi:hypothetical protein